MTDQSGKPLVVDLDSGKADETADFSGIRHARKYVLVDVDGASILAHGSLNDFPYHAALVEGVCRHFELAGEWAGKPDRFELFDKRACLRGGGWLAPDEATGAIRIYGYSTVYGQPERAYLMAVVGQLISDGLSFRIEP